MPRELLLPLQIDGSGSFAYTEDPARIVQQHIIAAVGTQVGERVMLPGYGSNLIQDVLVVGTETTLEDISAQVEDAVARLVPEVNVLSVSISTDDEPGMVVATIRYSLNNGTEDTVNVTLPNGSN